MVISLITDENLKNLIESLKIDREQKDSFIVVNRELSYLKQCMIDYMREQHVESMLKRIDLNEWVDYNDHVIQKQQKAKKKRNARSRRGDASSRMQALKMYSKNILVFLRFRQKEL